MTGVERVVGYSRNCRFLSGLTVTLTMGVRVAVPIRRRPFSTTLLRSSIFSLIGYLAAHGSTSPVTLRPSPQNCQEELWMTRRRKNSSSG